jgi:porin
MIRGIVFLLAATLLALAVTSGALAGQDDAAPGADMEQAAAPGDPASPAGLFERATLTGDWGGARTWLADHGVTLKLRLTQFYQGMPAGQGSHDFKYGDKADFQVTTDFSKLGLWKGMSATVHGEYNFGQSVNGYGGTLMAVNTALELPGLGGYNAFDLSSLYATQTFGDVVSLTAGKISAIDLSVSKPFMGGAGIDSFWNILFTAPPSGTVPAYMLGAILNVNTGPALLSAWVYDPNSVVNATGLDEPFKDGFTVRGSVSVPVTIAGLAGHQGLAASYSNQPGKDFETLDDIEPKKSSSSSSTSSTTEVESPSSNAMKNARYYGAYSFDQYLYQSAANPKEGIGLFGQVGLSDGNPNWLRWSMLAGIGGTGLIPGRHLDNYGVGYSYASPAPGLRALDGLRTPIKDEQCLEVFYNFAVTPWMVLGADFQVIKPSKANDTAIFTGLRLVITF